jgi:ABC-type Fe3+ transport system permease subunit
VTYANQAAEVLLDTSRRHLVGQAAQRLFADEHQLERLWQSAAAGDVVSMASGQLPRMLTVLMQNGVRPVPVSAISVTARLETRVRAARILGASPWRAFREVGLPLLRPAIVTALAYSFIQAMTAVSAVIFLVSAQYEMATVFIINRVINGDYGLAIAYSSALIVLMMAAIGLINLLVGSRRLGRRQAATPIGGRAS